MGLSVDAVLRCQRQNDPRCIVNVNEYFIRHVTIAHGGHGHDGPPERIRDGLEEGIFRAGLGEVYRARE